MDHFAVNMHFAVTIYNGAVVMHYLAVTMPAGTVYM